MVLAAPLTPAGAVALSKHVDQAGRVKRAMSVQGKTTPKGARLRSVGKAQRSPDALLRQTLMCTPLPFAVSFNTPGDSPELEAAVLTEEERTDLRQSLNPKLQVNAGHGLRLPGPVGHLVSYCKGASLVSAGSFRRYRVSYLHEKLRTAHEPLSPEEFTVGVDTQAVERNWRQINRHNATLRYAGRQMYMYLLHRIGHLLNQRRMSGV